MNYLSRKRTVMLFWIFIFVFTGMALHLLYIQYYQGESLSRQAIIQQSQSVALEIPARGLILDRNLKPLVSYRETFRVAIFPAAVKDKERAGVLLASVLNIDTNGIQEYLGGKTRLIPQDITAEQAAGINREQVQGVIAAPVRLRSRKPYLGAHLLGYLGRDGADTWNGKMGLEAYYNSELQGSEPVSLIRGFFDGRGRFISGLGLMIEKHPLDSARKNIILTIDRDIQEIVENTMDKAAVKDGAIVVMDARSGDIMAMASRPDYSLDEGTGAETGIGIVDEPRESFLNNALSLFQPGSVFKILVAAAALEEGQVKPETVFLCAGEKDDLVSCYEKAGHGLITFAQAFSVSCNPTFARVGLKLGAGKMIEYARKFGLTDAGITGYRSNDVSGRFKRIADQYNLVNASIGQWPVESTVVQITAMTGVIANDGIYNKPSLVREIVDAKGVSVRQLAREGGSRVVSTETATIMQTLMANVTRFGTGRQAWTEPWGSAGKTGSAQVGSAQTDAWFSGYAPLSKPRFVATVLVNNGESGGKSAAPLFREMMTEILKKAQGN